MPGNRLSTGGALTLKRGSIMKISAASRIGWHVAACAAAGALLAGCQSPSNPIQPPPGVAARSSYVNGCEYGIAQARFSDGPSLVRRTPVAEAPLRDWQAGYRACYDDAVRYPRAAIGR